MFGDNQDSINGTEFPSKSKMFTKIWYQHWGKFAWNPPSPSYLRKLSELGRPKCRNKLPLASLWCIKKPLWPSNYSTRERTLDRRGFLIFYWPPPHQDAYWYWSGSIEGSGTKSGSAVIRTISKNRTSQNSLRSIESQPRYRIYCVFLCFSKGPIAG